MQFLVLLKELLFALLMVFVGYTAIYGTDSCTLGLIESTNTLRALGRIDHIDLVSLGDGFVWTFGFASTAVDTLFCDLESHVSSMPMV